MTAIHLLKPHRHAGRDYPAGAALTLPPLKAQWLIGIGVATAANPVHLAPAPDSSPRPRRVGAAPRGRPGQAQGPAPTSTTETASE